MLLGRPRELPRFRCEVSEDARVWISEAGTIYRVRIDHPRVGPSILTFERVGGGWQASVPIHPSAVLGQLSRLEMEELLREAMEQ